MRKVWNSFYAMNEEGPSTTKQEVKEGTYSPLK